MKEPITLDAALTAATEPDADVCFLIALLETGYRLMPDTPVATSEEQTNIIVETIALAIRPQEPEPDTAFYPGPVSPYRVPPQPEVWKK